MASVQETSVPWYKRLFSKPSHLIVVTKQLAGGTEMISANFYIESLDSLEENVAKAYVVIDARAEVIKAEMKKLEAEMRKAAEAENKKDKK